MDGHINSYDKMNISIRMSVYMNSYLLTQFFPLTGTNRHQKELFVMAVRTPCGKTFPGNFSIIPSSKKWVFHAIFRLAFLQLYGNDICSMNWLVLTDEEDAEYRPFESLISTNEIFKSSKVMLCIFHAIWQPFKRDIYSLLPRKSKKGQPIQLTKVGSAWGQYHLLVVIVYFYSKILFIAHDTSTSIIKPPTYTEYSNTKRVFTEHKTNMIGLMFYYWKC